jgi:uncharacterized protein involved in cysteine biosynthesis
MPTARRRLVKKGRRNGRLLAKIVIAAVSPLVAAFVGTLIVGLWASRITERVQQRRQDRDLRESIIVEMTQTATALYLETQCYSRAI